MRKTRAEWEAWIAEIAAGRPAREISRREGLRHETLLWWKWRIGRDREAKVKTKKSNAAKKPITRALATFLPVESLERHHAPTSHEVTIEVAHVALHVPVGADPRYVAALVHAIHASC